MAKRLDSKNLLSGPAVLEVDAGSYSALVVRVDGLTAAGAAPTAASFGNVSAFFQNRPFASVAFADLQIIGNMDYGLIEATYGALGGNPFSAIGIIPASTVGDGNIFYFDANEANVRVDLSGISAVNVASGTVSLIGIPAEGTMHYIRQLMTQQRNIAASGTDDVKLTYENVQQIYMTALTNLGFVRVDVDSETVVDGSAAELLAVSNADCRIEAAFTTGIRFELNRSGALSEQMSDNIKMVIRATAGGACTPNVITAALDFQPVKLAASSAFVQQRFQTRLKRKIATGKGRPAEVISALSGKR